MRRNVLLSFAALALGAVVVPTSAQAAPIVAATGITSPQGDFGGGVSLANIINQSGLSAPYTSGVTDFDTYTAATTGAGLTGAGFTGTESQGPQQFVFDLGSATTIDAIAIWNSGSVGSITRFEVLSDDDGDFSNGTTGQLVGPSSLAFNTAPAQVFSFGATNTRYVIFNGLASLESPDFYGLNEVIFRGGRTDVPEPVSFLLVGLGAAAVARRRAQRR